MKIALLLVLSLFLVGCGNEYGIKHGSKVTVAFVGGGSMEGFMSKANGKVVRIKERGGAVVSIPKDNVKYVRSSY